MTKILNVAVKFEVGDKAYYAKEDVDVYVQSILLDIGSKSTEVSYLCVGTQDEALQTYYLSGNKLFHSKRDYEEMKIVFGSHPL